MFRKIVSNLPFQPSLLSEVSFYINRLKQEQAVRRYGLLLILVGFSLQIYTVIYPPQSSVATHQSDIVYGAKSKSDILNAYRRNEDQLGRKDIQAIYNHYGIAESQIQKADLVTISDGQKNFINTSRSNLSAGRTFVPISGAVDGGIYEFPLSDWRKNEFPNGYPALTGLSSYGFRFWILLKGCGNVVYEQGAKKPNLEIKKDRISGSQATVGSTVIYEIKFRNTGAVRSEGTVIEDKLPKELKFDSYSSNIDLNFSRDNNVLKWRIANKGSVLSPSSKWFVIKIKTQAVAKNNNVCNIALLKADNSVQQSSSKNGACVELKTAKCPGTDLDIPSGGLASCQISCPDGSLINYNQTCKEPQLYCSGILVSKQVSWNQRKLRIGYTVQNGAKPTKAEYYIEGVLVATIDNIDNDFEYIHTFSKPDKYSIQAKLYNERSEQSDYSTCTVVENITNSEPQEVIIATDKKVSNITQSIDDANNTTANAGDVLKYSLFIENKGSQKVEGLRLEGEYAEDVTDILEYADIKNLYDGVLNRDTSKITWAPVDIDAGQTITKTFEVTIKNPLPNTPVSSSNPMSYDYELFNTYGRNVTVKLNKSPIKNIESAASTLPNTGPNTSIMMMAILAVIAGYFYYRSTLLSKELTIIRSDYAAGGWQ